MSKIKNGALDQYGTGPFEQQQFGTAGDGRVKPQLQSLESKGHLPDRESCMLAGHAAGYWTKVIGPWFTSVGRIRLLQSTYRTLWRETA